MSKPIVVSGIRSTGNLHLGNYLGAIRNWVPLQDTHDAIYCVVDLHAITVWQEPAELATQTREMAAALIEAVEAKDPYTRGHSERVHHIAMEIGRALRLPARELDNLFWGSLLHDVGKIGIPDAVLCKPGRLTRDEFTFIMVHPERSYEILRHIDRLQGAVPGARHHQEKYDGTGYPHGLAGNDIPYNARIIAVARETMRRCRENVEELAERLRSMGYRFRNPDEAFVPPDADVLVQIAEIEERAGPLPLSLCAWYEIVGSVDFTG